MAYLAGVVRGDGWCTRRTLGMKVADRDFAEAFQAALRDGFGVNAKIGLQDGKYWRIACANTTGRFDSLLTWETASPKEKAAWCRGLFDSEGNACLFRFKDRARSFARRVSAYSTERSTLARMEGYLADLSMRSRTRSVRSGAGHLGTKQVYELSLLASREAFARFRDTVGSSIARKRATLAAIPESYCADTLADRARAMQRIGVDSKAKRRTAMLPGVLAQMKALAATGKSLTMRRCLAIKGYSTFLGHHYTHREIVAMLEEKP